MTTWPLQTAPSPTSVSPLGPVRIADELARALHVLGVRTAFGVVGGAVAPVADALHRSPIQVVHTRHESGAAFAAAEASLASGQLTVVFTTSGPGITNALTGLFVAREEGARVLCISGTTSASRRGRWPLQDSGPHALFGELYRPGALFHWASALEHPDQLVVALSRLARGLRRSNGFVAHLALPTDLQSIRIEPSFPRVHPGRTDAPCDPDDVVRCAELLRSGSVVLWVGYGARHCGGAVRELAERLGAPVMCTPRAKGIVPETHPLYAGVTGFGGHASTARTVAAVRPDHILVLGTRLGELSSGWSESLAPARRFVHVDLDPDVPGRAYPDVPTIGIRAELGVFLDRLLERIPEATPHLEPVWACDPPPRHTPRATGPVRPAVLVQALQDVVVDGSEAPILAEAGNAFAWTNHLLRIPGAGRYRVNMGWGSMGHAATGVVGAALARGGKAVALVGDGAMLMNCEVSTAVRYGVPAVWVVLDDGQYGMVEHGMRSAGFTPVETAIPPTDFAQLARSMGARGLRVDREIWLEQALRTAMAADGPFVVDVGVDPAIPAPVGSRLDNLRAQGVDSEEEG